MNTQRRPPILSVILCTHNRASVLKRAVFSLIRQTLSARYYELIVVENSCSDETCDVIHALQSAYLDLRIRLIHEPRVGLGIARNTGYKHAHGIYIVYGDDDGQAQRHWLERILRDFQTVHPTPDAVGGPVFPIYRTKKPEWFQDSYADVSSGSCARFLCRGDVLSGPNMAIRKDVLERFSGFDEDVGMKGTFLSLGEETGLFERMWRQNVGDSCRIFFDPLVIVYHDVGAYKLRVGYQLFRSFAGGQAFFVRRGSRSLFLRFFYFFGSLLFLIRFSLTALFSFPFYRLHERWCVERIGRCAFAGGCFLASLGVFVTIKGRTDYRKPGGIAP